MSAFGPKATSARLQDSLFSGFGGNHTHGMQFNFSRPMSPTEGNFSRRRRIIISEGQCVCRWHMTDALLNIAVFAVFVLCIVGFAMYGARNDRLKRN